MKEGDSVNELTQAGKHLNCMAWMLESPEARKMGDLWLVARFLILDTGFLGTGFWYLVAGLRIVDAHRLGRYEAGKRKDRR